MTEVTPNLPHLGNFCKYCFMGTLLVSVLALSVTFGVTSPKERGLGSSFAQKEKEKFTKKCKIGCVLVQNVVSYKGVQK